MTRLLVIAYILAGYCWAQSMEAELIRLSRTLDHSVSPISIWTDTGFHVVGSAFFVNQDGYFVTAAHVVDGYKPDGMTVTIRQRKGGGGGARLTLSKRTRLTISLYARQPNFPLRAGNAQTMTYLLISRPFFQTAYGLQTTLRRLVDSL